jgi:hypothetical protein
MGLRKRKPGKVTARLRRDVRQPALRTARTIPADDTQGAAFQCAIFAAGRHTENPIQGAI